MGKRNSILWVAVCVGIMFAAGSIYAGTAVQDVIQMDNKAYSEHTKSISTFSHKKHNEEYKIGCGECHHDAKGKPLNDLSLVMMCRAASSATRFPGRCPAI